MSPLHRLRLGVALALLTACGKPAPQQPTPEAQPAESLPPIKPIIDSVRHPPPRVIIPADTTPTPPPPPPLIRAALPVRLAMTGDINLGTSTQPKGVPADSGRSTFSKVDSLLVGDLVVGNFEGMFADSGVSKKCGVPDTAGVAFRADSGRAPAPDTTKKKAPKRICYAFATPSYLAPRLKEAGFTHLNLANNHANDFGHEARVQSDSILHSLPITTYGPLGQIAIDTLRQGDRATIVGLLGFTTYPWAYDLLDLEASRATVDSVKKLVDVLIVTFHGGKEGKDASHVAPGEEKMVGEPRGDLRAWARVVIDAGADAVVGHGPHVLRGIEFYKGKPIFYSLGNFATYKGFSLEGPTALSTVLQLELTGNGQFVTARLASLQQRWRKGPEPDPKGRAIKQVQLLTRQDFGPTGARIGSDGTVFPPVD